MSDKTKITLSMPEDAAAKLIAGWNAKDPQVMAFLADFGVISVNAKGVELPVKTPEEQTREILQAQYGAVWNTTELQRDFTVHSFLAPFVTVTRKSDGVEGVLQFTHIPRFYFDFVSDTN